MKTMTPMMQQYTEVKEQNKDSILLYRLGDFYEMFFDDALVASKVLDIALTARTCGNDENGEPKKAPMCGFPFHSADGYINKLIDAGHSVAICEQMEPAADVKGIVKRDVVRVITRGTTMDNLALDDKLNNYLCSIHISKDGAGAAYVDITTGELFAHFHEGDDLDIKILNTMVKYSPVEIIASQRAYDNELLMREAATRFSASIRNFYNWAYKEEDAEAAINKQFDQTSTELGLATPTTCALGALLEYLKHTQKSELANLRKVEVKSEKDSVELDVYTVRNLEIFETYRDRKGQGSLISVLDRTKTPMGGRLLRKWILNPLNNPANISNRQNAVEELLKNKMIRTELSDKLSKVKDIKRALGKIMYQNAMCRDLISLLGSFSQIPQMMFELQKCESNTLQRMFKSIDPLADLTELIEKAINPQPPNTIREGNIINDGYNAELDEKRRVKREGVQWINNIAKEEQEKTGLKNLKVGYNRVFGYYLEVSRAAADSVPDYFIRKQTLANCERYIIPRIKEIEEMILEADTTMVEKEYELFCEVRDQIAKNFARIEQTAEVIANLDVLCSLATVAERQGYIRPTVNLSDKIEIKNGRHPVVEAVLKDGAFIPNDTNMDCARNQIAIITGPNMAGKSTYMRQVALIVLLAQMGSFVPADSAEIGIVDKIFTRIGASDNLAAGDSTFMVEMKEVAYILASATPKSLIILDEIGRGTSTYDGLGIAWAVIEHIADRAKIGAKTLFATHYHELTELEERMENVKNYCIAVSKKGDDITFLRKIIPGGADDSFGVAVAQLAGVEKTVIKRAKEIVKALESTDISRPDSVKIKSNVKAEKEPDTEQFGFVNDKSFEVIQKIKELDLDDLTPKDALLKLFELSGMAKNM
ncbi:MAG: DNA mismatch repair protein MutS [Oscillospiraceae bacterium]|nr:DNA mismatch repair protein MutS [Oscillospiraceae bacterium]